MVRKGLGRGLSALIESADDNAGGVVELGINEIEPNADQPRKHFDDEKLTQLAESIKTHGIVQPLIVRKDKDTYRIVAGERRWRAARLAGVTKVPVVIKEVSDKQVMEIALIENLQREDLNPIEEAEAYERLVVEYKMTQEEISKSIGKSRSAIANSIRLLNLPDALKRLVAEGQLSSGHARALLPVEDTGLQIKLADEIVKKQLNVRETESYVKKVLSKKERRKAAASVYDSELEHVEERLREIFGTKVKIISGGEKGKILIEYYSTDELNRIIELVESLHNS